MLPEDDLSETVRPPMRRKRAEKLLDHMRGWKGKVAASWKARATRHQKKLDSGDPKEYAEVYKNLRTLRREGKLSVADRKHLQQSLQFLSEELAIALDKTLPQARGKIVEAARA